MVAVLINSDTGIFMIRNFKEVIDKARALGRTTVSVAAQDMEILKAVKAAYDEGIADGYLWGRDYKPMAEEIGLPESVRIIDEPDMDMAALKAVSLVKEGEGDTG